ncbi:MAG: DMT family transporter [Eubacterium sp.]|nr:DMT family transporter [Eubacterium sp.]
MNKKKKTVLIGCLSAIGCETIYGLSYVFTKKVTSTSSELFLLGWRFLLAFVVMSILALVGIIKINLKGKKLMPALIVSFFSPVLYFIGETFGISSTTATESGVFLACIPVATLVASTLILKKKPSKLQIAGIIVTVIGVTVTVVAVGVEYSLSIVGYGFLVLAVLGYALYAVFADKAKGYTGMEITYIMVAAGMVVFVLLAVGEAFITNNFNELVTLPFKDKHFMAAVLFQGIGCSVIAFFLSINAINLIGVNRTATFIGWATVVSVFAGAIFLQEHFSIAQFIGAIIIIVGVCIANAKRYNREDKV